MTIILLIIAQSIFLVTMVVLMIQLHNAKNAFKHMLLKFVNVNQAAYENQRMIVSKFSNLIISLDRTIKENHDALQRNKIDFDNQTQLIKDCILKVMSLNRKFETYSSQAGRTYEQLGRPSSTKSTS